MKSNNKQSSPAEEIPIEKRRRSASVDEIRDLYSVIQGLVPNTLPEERADTSMDPKKIESQSDSHQQEPVLSSQVTIVASEAKSITSMNTNNNNNGDNTSRSQFCGRHEPVGQKRSSCPLISVTHMHLPGRNRSQSLDTIIGHGKDTSPRQIILRQDSVFGNHQNKRLFKNTPKAQGELFAIVKDFDKVNIDFDGTESLSDARCNNTSAQSAEVHPKIASAKTHDNHLQLSCKNKSNTTDNGEGSTLKKEVSTTSIEDADKVSEKDFESSLSYCESEIMKKRLSLGDVLERQRARFKDPRTPYRRRSIGGSLLLNAIASSSSTSPKRRGSLSSAIALIARKNELQELLKNYEENKINERQNDNGKDEPDATQLNLNKLTAPKYQDKTNVQGEMDALLRSIEKQQQDSTDANREKLSRSEEGVQRPSVGAEMHNLLEAIQDLLASGQTTPANSTPPGGSMASSRRTSLNDPRPGKRKESLDELEAFFKAKLEDINENGTSKKTLHQTKIKPSKDMKNRDMRIRENITRANDDCRSSAQNDGRIREKLARTNDRRNSAPQTELRVPTLNQPEIHKSSSSGDLLKPSDALHCQRRSEDSHDSSRRRSRSAQDIQLTIPEEKTNPRSNNSSPRLKGRQSAMSRSTSSDLQADRALWKEDQVMFANQVNKRLQDWLERATMLSQQEAVSNDHTQDENFFVVVNSCSSDNESECKPKKSHSRFAMRKVLKKKIKRSKSIHDLTQPVEKEKHEKSPKIKRANRKVKRSKSLHSLLDKEESHPKETKQKTKMFRSPQSLLRIGRQHLLRSKSMHSSKKPPLDAKTSQATESDESFDDTNCTGINQLKKSSDLPKTSLDELDSTRENTGPRRSSLPGQNDVLDKTLKSKRLTRFPGHLPLFYQPGNEVQEQTTNDNNKQTIESVDIPKRTTSRKSFLFGNGETKHGMFYTQMNMKHNAVSPVSQTSSSGIDDEYIRSSPSQDGLNDTPSTSPDINDFRYRTTSVESEDSGCPI